MRCLNDSYTTDPYWNLAAEEYFLTCGKEPTLRLWRNRPSVIIGRYQNAAAEVDRRWVEEHGVPVVRRLSGGGAVFHDLGNINYTFTDVRREGEDTSAMFRRFTAPVISALRAIGVDAVLDGRNDLLAGGRKFSGCAVAVHRDRVLLHGTLLFDSSIGDLSAALTARPEKFIGRAVRSNAARVTNIREHLPAALQGMTAEDMMQYLTERIAAGGNIISGFSTEETAAIDALRESRYATREWNWGRSPAYSFHNSAKLPCGLVEVSLDVAGDVIRECSVTGDYFFTRPTEEFCEAMRGVRHSGEAIAAALSALPVEEFFGTGITAELTALMC